MRSISTQNRLLLIFVIILVLASILRLLHFTPTLREAMLGVDDWNRYAKQGIDIRNNGILIDSIKTSYNGPGGFLYNYFVASLFLLFGNSLAPIFLVQTIMLGLSVCFTFWSFKDFMLPRTQYFFLCSLFMFATLDVFYNYSHVLLSESFGLFLFSAFIYSFLNSVKAGLNRISKLGTILLSLATLVRPNLLPLLFIYLGIISILSYHNNQKPWITIASHFSISLLIMSAIAMRNHFSVGTWDLLPTEGTTDSIIQILQPGIAYFCKKLLFCFGYTKPLYDEYRIRPHWILMWIGYFIFLIYQIKDLSKIKYWQFSMNLFIAVFIILSVMFISLQSYGYRSMLLINFVVLALSILGFEKLVLSVQRIRMNRKRKQL